MTEGPWNGASVWVYRVGYCAIGLTTITGISCLVYLVHVAAQACR